MMPIFAVGVVAFYLALHLSFAKYLDANRCANTGNCENSFKYSEQQKAKGLFGGRYFDAPIISDSLSTSSSNILGEESVPASEKHIYVDLTTQTLSAFDGDKLFMRTLISSGKWYPSPTGEFRIWSKLKSTRMTGGEGDDYYDLPNVPFTMFFEGDTLARSRGFAIHGAYWHNNFGHAMSHGCINMRQTDVEKLYNWATPISNGHTTNATNDNPGTKITIVGEAP